MKKILLASSEAVPFIKTGGLADVVGALPKYFDKEHYEVCVILPKYACIADSLKKNLKYKTHFYVDLGWRSQYAGIFETELDKIHFYFIDNEYYFVGDRPYNRLHEDLEKFAFFSKAVLSALKLLDYKPDIIHCHDWQTALIPAYLRAEYQKDPFYQKVKTMFTIHNIRYQGRWKLDAIKDITGLPECFLGIDGLETYGEGDYLKGGIAYADIVTTVSENYVNEICTPEGGEGLDGILRSRRGDLYGIVNGIDYDLFNPKTDHYICRRYDETDFLAGKRSNKCALQEELGLPKRDQTFTIGIVSRMTDQKGLDLLEPVMGSLLKEDIQLIVLGSGEEKYEKYFRKLEWEYNRQVRARFTYTEEMAHKIYAGCDALLMPSMFEPCGLSQMISMRYGTIPMVRETGGLKDTVEPYNEYNHTGTGFGFLNYKWEELLHMVRYAYDIFYEDRTNWDAMALRCLKQEVSWNKSARDYAALYDKLVATEV